MFLNPKPTYRLRTTIKAQALADFVAEFTPSRINDHTTLVGQHVAKARPTKDPKMTILIRRSMDLCCSTLSVWEVRSPFDISSSANNFQAAFAEYFMYCEQHSSIVYDVLVQIYKSCDILL